jgi:hypothetical protein
MPNSKDGDTRMQGHVLIFARDKRWRRAVEEALDAGGHSQQSAGDAAALRELAGRQRFDVVTMRVRNDEEATELADALEGQRLPDHGVLVGSFAALSLIQRLGRRGTFRYVPGAVRPHEVVRLVEACISAGTVEEAHDGSIATQIEEVDLEEACEDAAASVYSEARKRNQRFNTVIEGPDTIALADAGKLRRVLRSLLHVLVNASPRGARISMEAHATGDDWLVRLGSTNGRENSLVHASERLQDETRALAAASRLMNEQGGLLWIELSGDAAAGLCLTLPLPMPAIELPASSRSGGVSRRAAGH